LLEKLIQKKMPEDLSYIKKIKDCKELKVSFKNEESKSLEDEDNFIICPVTKTEFNGTQKFIANWHCGCVFSRKALEMSDEKCPVCDEKYEQKDLINLSLAFED